MHFNLIRNPKANNGQSGSVMLAIVIMFPFFLLVIASYTQLAVSNFQTSRKDLYRTQAQFAVDAGADMSMEYINTVDTWTSTGGEVILHNGDVKTTYEASLAPPDPDPDKKTLTVTGRSYHPNIPSNTTPDSTVVVSIALRPVRSGEFSVVSGVGGLIMDNHAKILGGDVHVNGKISMKNHAQIGQTISPTNLTVAHQSCPIPADSSYPRICTNADGVAAPITIENDAHIYGDVNANNQTPNSAMTDRGLIASSGVAVELLPPHDREAMTTAINNAASSNSPAAQSGSTASCKSDTTKSWPANLKINGDVEISKKCKLTVNGNVWITGKFIVDNNQTEVIVAESLTDKPIIMVDGDEAKFSNSAKLKSNSGGKGFMVITYKSNVACTVSLTGCELSGMDLYNSLDIKTIELDNSAEARETIFYSKWSKVLVKNSGQIGALVGQTVDLSNSGAITFGASTGVGTEFWVIDSYKRIF